MEWDILVAVADAGVRSFLVEHLSQVGYQVWVAARWEEALSLQESARPLVTFLGSQGNFAVADFAAALAALQARDEGAEVILLDDESHDHGRETAVAALRAGASDILLLPVTAESLDAALQRALARRQFRQAQRRAARALEAERARFAWVVEHAQDGYVMLDGAGRIVYANPQASLYLDLPSPAVETVHAPSLLFREVAQRHYLLRPTASWESWPQPLESDRVPRYLLRPESSRFAALWLQVELVKMMGVASDALGASDALAEGGEGVAYLVRLRDVTSDIVNRNLIWSVGSLIGHKLRSPLGQLTGFLALLAHDLPQLSLQEIREDLGEARLGALELQDDILEILHYLEATDVSQPATGTCTLPQLRELIDEIERGLELPPVAFFGEAFPPEARLAISRQAMELILWELCENAWKFHPDKSPNIVITLTAGGQGAQLRVSDDGIPVAPEHLALLWLPYYQAEKTFTGEVPGMGLGLAMVASLVWRVGGSCRAYNVDEDSGLTIELNLPVQRGEA